jgi:chorismate mutase
MSAQPAVEFSIVPDDWLAPVWQAVAPFFSGFFEGGFDISLDRISAHTKRTGATLWVITVDGQLSAVFFARVGEAENGCHHVNVFDIGGHNVESWLTSFVETMISFAQHNGCTAVRFIGARDWRKLLPGCQVAGIHGTYLIYERAV